MPTAIYEASTEAHFHQFASLIADYFVWLRWRYQDQNWLIDQIAMAQSMEHELQDLSTRYRPPLGQAFLVEIDGELAGAGAWRRHHDGSCEMKRVFIRDAFKGRGAGVLLCKTLMQSAALHGHTLMRLDTGKRMTEAQSLYRKLGFEHCAPYLDYPAGIAETLEFMQVALPLPAPAAGR